MTLLTDWSLMKGWVSERQRAPGHVESTVWESVGDVAVKLHFNRLDVAERHLQFISNRQRRSSWRAESPTCEQRCCRRCCCGHWFC
jgi:hypothetical protein